MDTPKEVRLAMKFVTRTINSYLKKQLYESDIGGRVEKDELHDVKEHTIDEKTEIKKEVTINV